MESGGQVFVGAFERNLASAATRVSSQDTLNAIH
jgi:hypothetical protein